MTGVRNNNRTPSTHQTRQSTQTHQPTQTRQPTQTHQPTQTPRTPAPTRTAPQQNPHLSDSHQSQPMRQQIAQQSQQNPSFYGTLVGGVNSGLQRMGFGISPASHASVMNNLQQVSSGRMPQAAAHFNEAATFGQDAVQSFRHGNFRAGGMEAAGTVLNTIGGIGMSGIHGLSSHGFTSGASTGTLNNFE